MKEQFEKLRNQAFDANLFLWGSGSERYFGPVNPAGIIERTLEEKATNYLILAEHAPTIHLGIGYEDFPPRTEAVVFADLDQNFDFAKLDSPTKTLGGIGASDTPDGTIKILIKPAKVLKVTWRLLYPDPGVVFKELRPLPPEIDVLCQTLEHGSRRHRDQRIEALNKLQEKLQNVGREFLPELHERLNPLVGRAEDMGVEYYIASTLANLGDEDENIVREICLHLSLAKGLYDEKDTVVLIMCDAIRALSNVRHPDTVVILQRYLRNEDVEVRKAVICALGALGQEDGKQDLESICNQPDGDESRTARVALESFGTASFDQIRARIGELNERASAGLIRASNIYIYRNGKQHGPYPIEHVRSWLANGQVLASDLACYEGASEWVPLSSVPGVIGN